MTHRTFVAAALVATSACTMRFTTRGPARNTSSAPAPTAPSQAGPAADSPRRERPDEPQAREREELRRWTKACFDDYADFRAKWAPVEKRVRATLERLADESFYQAFPELRALYAGLHDESVELGLAKGASGAHAATDGIAFEVAAAIAELQRRHGATFTYYFEPQSFWLGHAVTGREELDRNHYCSRAYWIGTHRNEPAYRSRDRKGTILAPWLEPNAYDAFYEEERTLAEQAYESLRSVVEDGAPVPAHETGDVRSVRRKGGQVVVTYAKYSENRRCERTDRIDRVQADGKVEYEVNCSTNYDKPTLHYVTTVTFSDAPKDIRTGDEISFVGKKLGDDERPRFEGLVVIKIWRKGKSVGNWNLTGEKPQVPFLNESDRKWIRYESRKQYLED